MINYRFEGYVMKNIEYPEEDVFCPICHKPLINDDDKERGYHFHCDKSEVFCEDDEKESWYEILDLKYKDE